MRSGVVLPLRETQAGSTDTSHWLCHCSHPYWTGLLYDEQRADSWESSTGKYFLYLLHYIGPLSRAQKRREQNNRTIRNRKTEIRDFREILNKEI